MDKALDEIIKCITDSPEYLECIEIKKKMDNNEDITSRVKKIKSIQKKLLVNPSIELEEDLKKVENELNEIPIYVMYNQKLNIINEKISYVNDEINDYFYKLLNEE